VRGEHGADRDPLGLPTGQARQGSLTQLDEAQQVEGVLDPATHHVMRQRQ
jgi:hypothetical protein